jgi:uncharacterized protein YdeI (YjbR/CyaY-like superfamily)
MKPKFFKNQLELRSWFEKNHHRENELLIGYYKKATGIASIDWPQSVDEALCFGWIDGIRKSINKNTYSIRFTPRKSNSHWSAVNIKKVSELKAKGLMRAKGLEAFEKMDAKNSKQASYEQNIIILDKEYEKQIKSNSKAWKYFSGKLAPSAKKQSIHWIMSAKKEETRLRRLQTLIKSSEANEKVPPLNINKK